VEAVGPGSAVRAEEEEVEEEKRAGRPHTVPAVWASAMAWAVQLVVCKGRKK
jgi:hypothetical protein